MINDNLKSNKTLPRTVRLVTLKRLGSYHMETDAGAIALVIITVLLTLLAVAATSYDLDLTKFLPYGTKSKTFDLEKVNKAENINANKARKVFDENERTDKDKLGLKFVAGNEAVATDFASEDKGNVAVLTAKQYNDVPIPIAIDSLPIDTSSGSCKKCGKYKKQCMNERPIDNLSVCPRAKYDFHSNSTVGNKWKNVFCRFVLCFSLVYSWRRIFNKDTSNKELALMHGFKIVATYLIIYVHVSVLVNSISGKV